MFWLVTGNLVRECSVFATTLQKNGKIMQKYFDRGRKWYQIMASGQEWHRLLTQVIELAKADLGIKRACMWYAILRF